MQHRQSVVAFSAATRTVVPATDDRILVLTDERCRLTGPIAVVVRNIPNLSHQVQRPSLAHAHKPTMLFSMCDQSTHTRCSGFRKSVFFASNAFDVCSCGIFQAIPVQQERLFSSMSSHAGALSSRSLPHGNCHSLTHR